MVGTKGSKSLTHSGQNYSTRSGSKFYVRDGHRVKPYAQPRHGGARGTDIALLKKLLAICRQKKKPRRKGGNGGFQMVGTPSQRGFY